ncbi:MAG: hypothetical protein AB7O57_15330 [Hyphomicrobiaceae bacterium]
MTKALADALIDFRRGIDFRHFTIGCGRVSRSEPLYGVMIFAGRDDGTTKPEPLVSVEHNDLETALRLALDALPLARPASAGG